MRQGIAVFRITLIAYVLSSGLAALAGILLVSRLSTASPSMANAHELQAIAAAVVGGASAAISCGRARPLRRAALARLRNDPDDSVPGQSIAVTSP